MRFKKRLTSISVSLDDRVVYLAGSSDLDFDSPASENISYHPIDPLLARGSLLRGSVRIRVASQCSFRQLRVVLLGTLRTPAFSKAGPEDDGLLAQRYENLTHEVNILNERSPHFQAGLHELPFAVLLPPDLLPSFRCPYGRQEYTVHATAEEVDGKDHTSKPQPVDLLSSGDITETASPLLDVVAYNPSLGYVSATMHCEVPSVGAQALFQLDMPAPKPNISIVSIKVALVQTVRVYTASGNVLSRTSEKQVARCFNAMPVTSGDLAGAKSAYVPRWKEGEPVSVVNNVLLPTHETFAPSTNAVKLSSSFKPKLRMTVSHHAVIKVRFQPAGFEKMKEVTITSRNIFLLSCKCLPNSLVLPPYTPKAVESEQTDEDDSLTWLGLNKRRALTASGLENCTCFTTKISTGPPVGCVKAVVPQPTQSKLAGVDCPSSGKVAIVCERV